MARRMRQAAPSEQSRAASLLMECVTCVDLHYNASPKSGMLVANSLSGPEPPLLEVPYYDVIRRQLSFLGVLIKKLRSDAFNQICCFTSYQEQEWEGPLFDPLSPKGVIDPHKRFLDTVEAMNEHHVNAGLIKFLPDGCESVFWAPGTAAKVLVATRGLMDRVRLNPVGAS